MRGIVVLVKAVATLPKCLDRRGMYTVFWRMASRPMAWKLVEGDHKNERRSGLDEGWMKGE